MSRRGFGARLGCVYAILALGGCSAFRVTPKDVRRLEGSPTTADAAVRIERESGLPGGWQCFEPMLFMLTLGIVPTHCVETYQVSITAGDGELSSGTYEVSSVGGWAALFLLPSRSWRAGGEVGVRREIERQARGYPGQ